MKFRESGNFHASKIVKDLRRSRRSSKKYVTAITKRCDQSRLTSYRLCKIWPCRRKDSLNPNMREHEEKTIFFSCYSILQRAIKVQRLMDHSEARLILYLREFAGCLNSEKKMILVLFSKWGCDGSQQMEFKMKLIQMSIFFIVM